MLTFLSGFKTYIAGFGLIGLGIYQCTQGDLNAGLKSVSEGLAVIGLGHKLAKMTPS